MLDKKTMTLLRMAERPDGNENERFNAFRMVVTRLQESKLLISEVIDKASGVPKFTSMGKTDKANIDDLKRQLFLLEDENETHIQRIVELNDRLLNCDTALILLKQENKRLKDQVAKAKAPSRTIRTAVEFPEIKGKAGYVEFGSFSLVCEAQLGPKWKKAYAVKFNIEFATLTYWEREGFIPIDFCQRLVVKVAQKYLWKQSDRDYLCKTYNGGETKPTLLAEIMRTHISTKDISTEAVEEELHTLRNMGRIV